MTDATTVSPDAIADGGAGHAWRSRLVGCLLGALAIGEALRLHGAPAVAWVLLAAQTIAWPWLAHRLAARSGAPEAAGFHNLLVDAALCGAWAPAISFEPLPLLALSSLPWMNALALRGGRGLGQLLAAQAAAVGPSTAVVGFHPAASASLALTVACAPLLVGSPLRLAHVLFRLRRRLADRKQALQRSESLHRSTLDAMRAGVVLWDADDRLLLCNAEFRNQYGPLAAILQPGRRFEDLLRLVVAQGLIPEAAGREEAWIRERLDAHRHPGVPIEREFADGRWQLIQEQRLPDGAILSFTTDVTAMVRSAADLAEARADAERAHDRLQDAIEALPDAFALYDADDRLVAWNSTYLRAYAESSDAARVGATFESLLRVGLARGQYPEAAGREEAWLEERLAHHRQPSGPLLQKLPGNRWMRINERRTREGGYAGVRTDVTDLVRREQDLQQLIVQRDAYEARLRQANEQLELLSATDALTGLGNRRLLDRRLAEEWQRAQRHGLPLALLIVDIDHFKAYNDRYGHPEGDRCLRDVAAILRAAAQRSGDVVARYGGEEFALLLPHTTLAQARATAQRCMDGMAAAALPHADSSVADRVTLSIGIAVSQLDAPPEGTSPDADAGDGAHEDLAAFIQRADAALYEAKRTGRHRVAG